MFFYPPPLMFGYRLGPWKCGPPISQILLLTDLDLKHGWAVLVMMCRHGKKQQAPCLEVAWAHPRRILPY